MMTLPSVLSTLQAKRQGEGHIIILTCILVDYLRVPESTFWGRMSVEFALLTLQTKLGEYAHFTHFFSDSR